jgi:hypothetical protein
MIVNFDYFDIFEKASDAAFFVSSSVRSFMWVDIDQICPNGSWMLPCLSPFENKNHKLRRLGDKWVG